LERMVGKYCLPLAALGFGNSIMLRSFTAPADVVQARSRIAQHRRSQPTLQLLVFLFVFCSVNLCTL
jgi:hypothetical protein